ncbi:NodB-like proteiny domain-containing protein [Entamoeba marina]
MNFFVFFLLFISLLALDEGFYCDNTECLSKSTDEKLLCSMDEIVSVTEIDSATPNCLGQKVCETNKCGVLFDNCVRITCECAEGIECIDGFCNVTSSSESTITSSESTTTSESVVSSSEPSIASSEVATSCGDGICADDENCIDCPSDCSCPNVSADCGNGFCDSGETYESCPEDCANTDYECNSTICSGSNCRCCSTDNPGSLSNDELPQFIFITVDDAVKNSYFTNYYQSILESKVKDNRNCYPKMTFFPHNYDGYYHNDYQTCEQLQSYGCEIASHSYSHPQNLEDYATADEQLRYSKLFYSELSQVSKLDGYRSPYLLFTEESLKATKDNGFLYHSGVIHEKNVFGDVDLWPYTYDFGAPTIGWDDNSKSITSKLKGLWEIPLIPLVSTDDTVLTNTMDYPYEGDELLELLKYNFEKRHSSNKAPFGIYLHGSWFTETRTEALTSFIDYATSTYKDVFFATGREIISYMQNPVTHTVYSSTKCGNIDSSECLSGRTKSECSYNSEHVNLCGECPESLPTL